MDSNSCLREALINHYETIEVPNNLKHKVLERININKQTGFSLTRKAAIACLIVFLIAPAVAFGYPFLAAKIYGPPDAARQYGITESEYNRLDNKLYGASKTLSPQDFAEFIVLLKSLALFMMENGERSTSDRTKFGQVDVSKLSPEKQQEYNELMNKIQPYFDKLNQANGIK